MRRAILTAAALASVLLAGLGSAGAAEITEASQERLNRWLAEYPEADANRDGKLTLEEAEAYRRVLERRHPRTGDSERLFPFKHDFALATMSDGVEIALAVGYPAGFDASANRKWPAIFTTCGYTSATAPLHPGGFGNRCVTVSASIRGTGASGGALSPWSPRTWQDGYEVIEDWIAKRPWSNGRVGIVGHSWPGLMGFLVSTTDPPSLKAVCVSGLIEDFYRGIAWPGGVRNRGFPVDWLNQYYRPDGPFGSGTAARLVRRLDDDAYRAIVEARPERDLAGDMLWNLLTEPYDCPRWQEQSLSTYAPRIRAPILLGHAYQDEQTGPSGLWLWKRVPDDVPKRLVLSNGAHDVSPSTNPDAAAWFEHWLLGEGDGAVADPERRVQVYFETALDGDRRRFRLNPPLEARDFPLPDTRWTRYYLHSGGRLAHEPPGPDEPPARYRVVHDEPVAGPDRVEHVLEFDEPTAICGPLVLTLWATATTLDTDFFALVGDRTPDGEVYGLQRGLLRASHRQLDAEQSTYAVRDGERLLIRPHHPHTRAEPVTPYEPCRFEIEIPVVGHVFRPGHQLVLRVGVPPRGDPIGITKRGGPSYRYDSDQPPGAVEVLGDAEHASSLLLPVLPALPPVADEPPPLAKTAGLQLAP